MSLSKRWTDARHAARPAYAELSVEGRIYREAAFEDSSASFRARIREGRVFSRATSDSRAR